MPGESQKVPETTPDPSVLATEAIARALAGERDYQDARHEVMHAHAEAINQRVSDLQSMLQERYDNQTKAVEAAFTAADKAVDKALDAAEKAVDRRQDTLDREFHEHLEQVRHENALASLNADKAVEAALQSAEKAVGKAEVSNEKRFEAVNEFRAQLNDQAATFITRTEYGVAHDALEKTVIELANRFNRTEGHSTGLTAAWGILLGVAALVSVAVAVIVATR